MSEQLLLWTDIETTGVDESEDAVLEIGMLVTDWDLHSFDWGFHVCIRPSLWRWKRVGMSPEARRMHEANGLLEEIDTARSVPARWAIAAMDDYLRPYLTDWVKMLLAGSSVDFDRRFLRRLHPDLFDERVLGHRVMDVSVLDEIARNRYPDVYAHRPDRTTDHRVSNCLTDSMNLYSYYQQHLLTSKESGQS
ncbi:MAG: oligoribonuclease [Bifidobacterium psychraerophilum]|uniref:oligoribonuclease n=1 Tax=Bifidobacterium psychraerophilum TaxID=218140 RepID=UPI0039E91CFE